jgi:two-component system chemotaxis response regulator CheB
MAQSNLTTTRPPARVVVMGGSTGSIEVLLSVLPSLPTPLPYTLILVVHRKNTADSTLARLLSAKIGRPVREVEDKDELRPGAVYVAPADYHLLVERNGLFALDDSEKVHYCRPAIDVTFESVADAFGPAAVGVLLSGANADGTAGLAAIRRAGGWGIIQDPATAQVAYMPEHALHHAGADEVLDVPGLIAFLGQK